MTVVVIVVVIGVALVLVAEGLQAHKHSKVGQREKGEL